MKAVIVEIKGINAAILSDDGCISQIKNKNYTIGQEIIIKKNVKYMKWVATAAAAVMLFATPAWAYLTPYSYVSLDVNPSFEFSINRFDRVLEVRAVNDAAKEVIEEINIEGLKYKEIQEAVKNVLNELKNKGYIIEGKEGGVVVATSSKNEEKTENLAAKLKIAVNEEVSVHLKENKETVETVKTESAENTVKTESTENNENAVSTESTEESEDLEKIEKETKDLEKPADKSEKFEESKVNDKDKDKYYKYGVEVEVIGVSQEKVNEAKERGVTPGKMNLVEKLHESATSAGYSDESVDEEYWLEQSVKDIMNQTKKYNKEKEETKETKEKEDTRETKEKQEIKENVSDNKTEEFDVNDNKNRNEITQDNDKNKGDENSSYKNKKN